MMRLVHIKSVYLEHFEWLVRWLNGRVRCTETARDLSQDTFVRLLTLADPERIDSPRAWLMVVANRLMINNFHRKRLEHDTLEQVALLVNEESPSAEAAAQNQELLALVVDTLISELSERHRQVLLMSRVQGMTYKEISNALNISTHNVKYYLVSSVARLHERLFEAKSHEH